MEPVDSFVRPAASDHGALTGIVVADFSRVLAAPYATMLLGDLGADVIKVERPGLGDDTRHWGPPFTGDNEATYFLSVNRNKRSYAADLSDPDDQRDLLQLVQRADVLIENFRPNTMAKHGLSYEQVAVLNPGLVYCSITGFGSGPGATALPGYDLLVQAVGGLMSVTGPREGEPVRAGVAVVDVLTGLHATIGVLAALHARETTGRGQHVEVNLLSTLLSSMVNQSAGYTAAGAVPGIMGNRHPSVAPYQVFATADRQVIIAVGNDRQFGQLCAELGMPELANDPKFATNSARVAHIEELDRMITAQTVQRTADHWQQALVSRGVPCGPVNDLAEAFTLAERLGLSPRVPVGDVGDAIDLVANPIEFSDTPTTYPRRPPDLGQHTEEIRAWLRTANPVPEVTNPHPTPGAPSD